MELVSRPPTGWRSALAAGAVVIAAIAWLAPAQLVVFGVTLLLVALTGFVAVPLLRRWKAQHHPRGRPQSHLKKAGTPTMGGIFFIPWALVVPFAFAGWNLELVAAVALAGAYGLVGWIDDFQIIRQQSNNGITPARRCCC